MDILTELVDSMDRSQVRNFKSLITRSGGEQSRKDLELFNLIRKGRAEFDEDKAFKKLYPGETDRNSFYQLKARLLNDITLSIYEQAYDKGSVNTCLYFMVLANHFIAKGRYEIGWYFLAKAEKKGLEAEKYSLLEVVYYQMAVTSKHLPRKNPETYIAKYRKNQRALIKIGDIDIILIEAETRLRKSLASGSSKKVIQTLNDLIATYENDPDIKDSVRLQIGLYQTISRIFLEKREYEKLELYLQRVLEEFERKKYFSASNHRHKLQILAWLSNALFINGKYKLSLEYTNILHAEMLKHEKRYYERFEFFYYTCLVNNYSRINPDRAIEILLSLIKKGEATFSYNAVFVFVNLVTLYYGQKNYSKAIKYLQSLYNYPGFASLDMRMRMRIITGEFMIRLNRGEKEILQTRLRQIANELSDFEKQGQDYWEIGFLNHIRYLGADNPRISSPEFRAAVKQTISKIETDSREHSEEENMPFPYGEWLKERLGL